MRNRSAKILYLEPKRIADWREDMVKSGQSFSGKAYAIRLLHVFFDSDKPLCKKRVKVIKETIADYPELASEVRERFPNIF